VGEDNLMNHPALVWIDVMLRETQRCHHLSRFLYGCIEREHVLNMDACITWWVLAFTPAAGRPAARQRLARRRPTGALGHRVGNC
jgi:hypothetical protein